MYIIIVLSFLFYTYTYYYILLIFFSRDYLEIFGGRFGRIWIAPVISMYGIGNFWLRALAQAPSTIEQIQKSYSRADVSLRAI